MVWAPKRTIKECRCPVAPLSCMCLLLNPGDAILCGPGMPHEMESRVVDGRVLRVYKNLWPSLRSFWLWATSEFSDKTYIVYEDNRSTFEQILSRSLLAASVFKNVYHVQKGDRVAICARNIPDYLVAYWACHLLGAVTVLVNAYVSAHMHDKGIDASIIQLAACWSFVTLLDSHRMQTYPSRR